jgi:hypothetical protein
MAAKVSGGMSKAGKAATQVTRSNGAPVAPAATRVKPLPSKVLKNLAALGEPYRLAVLGVFAGAATPLTLAFFEGLLLGDADDTALAVNHLKRLGWLTSERVPKSDGGGWCYRLSDAGRERLMALGS